MGSLIVWMNGEEVGEWGSLRGGTAYFHYARSWAESARARPLSLSLPLTADLELRGPGVESYFENLLPDNPDIRRRIRARFRTPSSDTFDLLAAVGRDCAGAVQLLPHGEQPVGWDRVDAVPLTASQIERTLRSVTSTAMGPDEEEDDFRISLAGAQEKTALLGMADRWFRPRGSTPTTHILKLPLGIVGGFAGDFSDSVENEWLCGQLLHELGLRVAESRMERFGDQRALVVKRFDRAWIGVEEVATQRRRFKPREGMWIARLPQEDLCQATGRPSSLKYEADGGPSMLDILALLAGSEDPSADGADFLLAQLSFWLLAATDGHAKNFSIGHRASGTYRLLPLYDVLSAWPVAGHGVNKLPLEKARLAMAVRGRRPHYRINEIQARHWHALADGTGIPGLWSRMQALVAAAVPALDRLGGTLPDGFPVRVFEAIRAGVSAQAQHFMLEGQ